MVVPLRESVKGLFKQSYWSTRGAQKAKSRRIEIEHSRSGD